MGLYESIRRGAPVFAALALLGCEATTSGPEEKEAISADIVATTTVAINQFQVCKTYIGAVGPTVTVDYNVDFNADGPGPQDVAGSVQLAPGACTVVHTYDESNAANGSQIQRVSVTEQVPLGYTASYVKTTRTGPYVTVDPVTPGDATSGDMLSAPDNGFVVEFINTEFLGGGEGCTPGYWKQEHHFDSYPAPLTPATPFIGTETGFTYDPQLKSPASGNASSLTLLDALSLRGGGVNALIRHAAAAILNANSPSVASSFMPAQVQTLYNNDMDKDALEQANEQLCPLN